MDRHDYAAATKCVLQGADPDQRYPNPGLYHPNHDKAPLNRLLWFGNARNAISPQTLPLIDALIEAGADVNYRPQGEEASALEALLESSGSEPINRLIRKMILAGASPNASVSMRRSGERYAKVRMSPLLWSIKYHQNDLLERLLSAGADPDHIESPGMATPLFHAAHYNNAEAIRILLAHGAKLDRSNAASIANVVITALAVHDDALRALTQAGLFKWIDQPQQQRLFVLLYNDRQATPELTLQVMKSSDYDFAGPKSNMLEQLMRVDADRLPQADNNRRVFRWLLEQGANANWQNEKKHNSLLQLGCAPSMADPLKTTLLLSSGADVNHADVDGDTPLHQCALSLHEVLKKMIEHRQGGQSVMRNRFAKAGDINEIMAMALGEQPKVDVMAQLQQQYQRLLKITKLLVKAGADLKLKNKQGKTAFDIASDLTEALPESDIQHLRP